MSPAGGRVSAPAGPTRGVAAGSANGGSVAGADPRKAEQANGAVAQAGESSGGSSDEPASEARGDGGCAGPRVAVVTPATRQRVMQNPLVRQVMELCSGSIIDVRSEAAPAEAADVGESNGTEEDEESTDAV